MMVARGGVPPEKGAWPKPDIPQIRNDPGRVSLASSVMPDTKLIPVAMLVF